MSESITDETIEAIKKGIKKSKEMQASEIIPEKVIEIRHTGLKGVEKNEDDSELSKTKEKLEEREAQLATIVLSEFEKGKKQLLESIPEDRRQQLASWIGENPDRLEQIRGQQIASGKQPYDWEENPEDLEKVPPKGIIGLPQTNQKYRSGKEVIDDLYGILENPNSSAKELEQANQKIFGTKLSDYFQVE